MTYFPDQGESREDQEKAKRLAWRIRDGVAVALSAAHSAGATLKLDVRVSRRRGVGPCIILHQVNRPRVLPWSWPLNVFTHHDAELLRLGELPEVLHECVREWTVTLRSSPLPKVTA